MQTISFILFLILWAYLCYHMAKKRGRNTTLGVILGACFGLFAVIGYAIAGNKKTPAE